MLLPFFLPFLLPFLPFSHPYPEQALGNLDFPDPSITYDPRTQKWYSFATQSASIHVQAASSPFFFPSTWSLLPKVDLLPVPGKWVNSVNPLIWAPDVHYINSSSTGQKWIMYYSGLLSGSEYHCVGAAVSYTGILGPYEAGDEPYICPVEQGGAIDASGYEEDGKRYVVYKVDGSAKGPGGPCGNGIPPGEPTPLRLQEVYWDDGVTKIGEEVELLDRDSELDGPLIEAPNLVKIEGKWVLFYSSHCYNSGDYDVKYAVSEEGVKGPYVRGGQLIGKLRGNFGFRSPGGASAVVLESGRGGMVFHADCGVGRCMWETEWVMGRDGVVGVVE
ncbi:family 43 putative glycoside hydrolase [Podospora fimiseda]|uniref:Family 43 putative glycoside hydrolase n=1 Tax=Podospora fimiseda TaxID=252190 RepID=A0AAN7BIN1_9PEZI|nr:family 43 putative glycoside hydrolase [Podospora fimiseda]